MSILLTWSSGYHETSQRTEVQCNCHLQWQWSALFPSNCKQQRSACTLPKSCRWHTGHPERIRNATTDGIRRLRILCRGDSRILLLSRDEEWDSRKVWIGAFTLLQGQWRCASIRSSITCIISHNVHPGETIQTQSAKGKLSWWTVSAFTDIKHCRDFELLCILDTRKCTPVNWICHQSFKTTYLKLNSRMCFFSPPR